MIEEVKKNDSLVEVFKQIVTQIKNEKPEDKNISKKKTNKKYECEPLTNQETIINKSLKEILNLAGNDFYLAKQYSYELFSNDMTSKATEFIAKFLQNNNYIYTLRNDKETEVWIYQDGIYVQQGKCLIREQIRRILGSAYSIVGSNNILAKIEVDTMTDTDFFFNQMYLPEYRHFIPIKNGLYNLNTNKLEIFNPKIIFTTKLPLNFNPNSICPTIKQFLQDVLVTDEKINLFFEIAGFSIYREYFIEKAIMFEGFGRNGKSKTQELLRNFIGIDNTCSVPLSEMVEGSFSICELFKKHLNIAGDISHDDLKDTSALRKTVGRDRINAKRKFQTDIKFTNFAKHIFSCNELPKTYDITKGFWDKWILISFDQTFMEQKEFDNLSSDKRENIKPLNPNIIDSLVTQNELDGLFIEALKGLERIRKQKEFSLTKSSEEIKKIWVRKSDSFLTFALENLESAESDIMISKSRIRKHYFDYCKQFRLRGCSDMVMKITLQENFGVDEFRSHEQQTFWTGLKIKSGSKFQTDIEIQTDKDILEFEKNRLEQKQKFKEDNTITFTVEKPTYQEKL